MKRLWWGALLLPLAAAASPQRQQALDCAAAIEHGGATAAGSGAVCLAVLAAVRSGADGIPGDAQLAEELGQSGAGVMRDFADTLPVPAPRKAVDPSTVAAVLAGLPDPAAKPRSLWYRIDAWLRRMFMPSRNADAPPPDWMRQLVEALKHLPAPLVIGAALLLLLALVVALGWMVVLELRAAGIKTVKRRTNALRGEAWVEELPRREIERLPERERPAALLRWVIERLAERGALPADRALTNRELQALLPEPLRQGFGGLIGLAERVFFGGARLSPAEMDCAAELARALTRTEAGV